MARTRAMENLALHPSTSTKSQERSTLSTGSTRYKAVAHVAATSSAVFPNCTLCKAIHFLAHCSRYQAKTPDQRKEIIITYRRYFNCLGSHSINQCRSIRRCMKCGRNHHTSLHRSNEQSTPRQMINTPLQQDSSPSHENPAPSSV